MDPHRQPKPDPREGERRWLDKAVGYSAILVALISLVIALRQSQIMERQLAASAWPYLQYGTSNESEDGKQIISLDVENAGVGPARVHSLSLRYKDRPMHTVAELMDACCGDLKETAGKSATWTSTLHGRVLTPGQRVHFLVLNEAPVNASYWARLNQERKRIDVRICFCSVLDQCWVLDSTKPEHEPIAACPAPGVDDFDG